jgi:Kelch motif
MGRLDSQLALTIDLRDRWHLDGNHGDLEVAIVEAYNPVTNTWSEKTPMPTPRSSEAATITRLGTIYAIGGNVGDPGVAPPVWSDAVEEYDPVTDSWTVRISLPVRTMELGAALDGDGAVHVFGGWTPTSQATAAHFVACTPHPTHTRLDRCSKEG